jgi:bifunctional DNase/RNase
MAGDPGLELIDVKIERVIGFRESQAAAVVLTHPEKKFLIFVGPTEGAAVQRELSHQKADRPATHDLLDYVMKGFDIEVKRVVVSTIVNNVFCATLILVQKGQDGAPSHEVRLDARASDSIVIAMKAGVPLSVTRRGLDAVEDATAHLEEAEKGFSTEVEGPGSSDFELETGDELGEEEEGDEGDDADDGDEEETKPD